MTTLDTSKRVVLCIDLAHFRARMSQSAEWAAAMVRRGNAGLPAVKRIVLEGAGVDFSILPAAGRKLLIQLAGASALDTFVHVLGAHSAHPTYEQLSDASDKVLDSHAVYEVVCALEFVVLDNYPAAALAKRLIDERFLDVLPVLPEKPEPRQPVEKKPRTAPKVAKVAAKKAKPSSAPVTYKKKKGDATPIADTPTSGPRKIAVASLPVTRREPPLTLVPKKERESVTFDHPLVGKIVRIDLPFLDWDDQPTGNPHAFKNRRCLVVGVGPDFLIVRGIFSLDRDDRTLFRSWRKYMDHQSYISRHNQVVKMDLSTIRIPRKEAIPIDEWNDIV